MIKTIELEKGQMIVVDDHSKLIDGYLVKDFPVFGIVRHQGRLSEWQWSIVHIPSESIFSDIFRTKTGAEVWLDIFLEEVAEPKRLLLTVPGIKMIQVDFAEEIRTAFAEWHNWRR